MGAAVRVGEAENTLLPVLVTHLADSPVVALVRDSAGRGDILLVDFLVAKITVALVIVASVTIVSFSNSFPGLFIGLTILTTTPTWIPDRITTINLGTIQPRLRNRSPSDPPSTVARFSSASTQATPDPWIRAPTLLTPIAATARATQQGNKE